MCATSQKANTKMNTLKTQKEGGSMNEAEATTESIPEAVILAEEGSAVLSTTEVWRRKMVSMAYVAASTVLAYGLIASFVFLAE